MFSDGVLDGNPVTDGDAAVQCSKCGIVSGEQAQGLSVEELSVGLIQCRSPKARFCLNTGEMLGSVLQLSGARLPQ